MFAIRPEHMQVLAEASRDSRRSALLGEVRARHPEWAHALEDDRPGALESLLARAAELGLSADEELLQFVDVCVRLGESFDTDPQTAWAGALIRDPDIASGPMRLRRLVAALRRRDETAAENARAEKEFADASR